jgi:hypothetical protein
VLDISRALCSCSVHVRRSRAGLDPRPSRGRPPPRPAETSDPRLAHLPTAEQIALKHATGLDPVVRRRPIGAVTAEHPLWREVQQAMREFGGSVARLLRDILDRAFPLQPPPQTPAMQAAAPGPASAPTGTGPS